ncbi:hypothetical protein J132_02934 [Termitomyces sp. J132]|nr:hypothetical protein J132_02934 [Termitomyces sp. J132]
MDLVVPLHHIQALGVKGHQMPLPILQGLLIIHSAMLCDGSLHVKYAMPAWWAIEELKKRYSYADFDYTSF